MMNTRTALALVAGASFFACTSTAHAATRTPDIVMVGHGRGHAHRHVGRPLHATGVLERTANGTCTGAHADDSIAPHRDGASTIVLAAGTYKLTIKPGTNTDDPATGDLDIDSGAFVSVDGVGSRSTLIASYRIDRSFAVHPGASLPVSKLTVENGKGYVPATQNRPEDAPIGLIPVDALFSPVRKVRYKVDNTRVGQVTDYDKLSMRIETNGAVTPEDAVALAARILQDQLQLFINFEEPRHAVEKEIAGEPLINKNLLRKVDELE